jgi:phage tail sheath gpL-like
MVSFNQIPDNLRVPFAWFELNPSRAPYQTISRLLLIGQKTDSGTAAADVPIIVAGGEDGLFGVGSQLAAMYDIARANAPFQEIWCLPLADAVGGAAATGSIAFPAYAPLARSGSLILYIGGKRIAVPVNTFMTNYQMATALRDAINSCPKMQVSAAAVAGVKGNVTVTYTLNAPGSNQTLPVTVNGILYSVPILAADTAAQIAAKVAAAIDSRCGFTATANSADVTFTAISAGVWANSKQVSTWSAALNTITNHNVTSGTNDVVNLTARNKGTLGNGIRIETRMLRDDSELADEILLITQMSGGSGDPLITNAISGLGDDLWDFIVMPYAQAAYLDQIEAWLAARWSPIQQSFGLNFTAMVGKTFGEAQSFFSTRNSQFTYPYAMYNSPQPAELLAAAWGAQAAVHLQSPPELSRRLGTLQLIGIRPPKHFNDAWTTVQRQSFYYAGLGSYFVTREGTVHIDRMLSTYQRDVYGNPDQSFMRVNTLAQAMYGLRYLKAYVEQTFPRCALVDENPDRLQNFVTVSDIHDAIVHAYRQLESLGVFENSELFARLLIVERSPQDPDRVNAYIPVDHVNQFEIFAGNVTSHLQFSQ